MVIYVPDVPVRAQLSGTNLWGVRVGEKDGVQQEPKQQQQQREEKEKEKEGRRSTRKKQATSVYGRDGVDARSDKVERAGVPQ